MPLPSETAARTSKLDIKSILLLDDDAELAAALKDLLEIRNFVVTTVNDGAEGLREVMQMDFDVIVCDLLMPGIPGDMFYLAIRKLKPHLADRFVFITGHKGDPKIDGFLNGTCAAVIYKPVLIDELVGMITFVLNRSAGWEAEGWTEWIDS
jgi:DNA-binding response OmpR family regulator